MSTFPSIQNKLIISLYGGGDKGGDSQGSILLWLHIWNSYSEKTVIEHFSVFKRLEQITCKTLHSPLWSPKSFWVQGWKQRMSLWFLLVAQTTRITILDKSPPPTGNPVLQALHPKNDNLSGSYFTISIIYQMIRGQIRTYIHLVGLCWLLQLFISLWN